MMESGLQFINDCMEELMIPYEFQVWTDVIKFPFFVGEYAEIPTMYEDGSEESTFMLTGTTNKSFNSLETLKNEIKNYFTAEGITKILPDRTGIAVSYENSFPVPTGVEDLQRIQINLKIKQWKVE